MDWITGFPQVFVAIYLLLKFAAEYRRPFLITLLLMHGMVMFLWLAVLFGSCAVDDSKLRELVWLTATAGFGLLWRQTIGLPLADRVQEWLDSEPEPSPDDYPPR